MFGHFQKRILNLHNYLNKIVTNPTFNRIRDEVDPEANIIIGSTFDSELTGSIRVSVVATGIDVAEFSKPSSHVLNELEGSEKIEVDKTNQQTYFSRDILHAICVFCPTTKGIYTSLI